MALAIVVAQVSAVAAEIVVVPANVGELANVVGALAEAPDDRGAFGYSYIPRRSFEP